MCVMSCISNGDVSCNADKFVAQIKLLLLMPLWHRLRAWAVICNLGEPLVRKAGTAIILPMVETFTRLCAI